MFYLLTYSAVIGQPSEILPDKSARMHLCMFADNADSLSSLLAKFYFFVTCNFFVCSTEIAGKWAIIIMSRDGSG